MNLFHPPGKKLRTAIYVRVSTQEQKVEGYGLEYQEKYIKEYVAHRSQELEVVKVYRDTHTGSTLNREALTKLMENVKKKKYDAVVVWKIDRLSRNLKHLLGTFETMQAHKVSFISVQENIDFRGPIGGLVFQIFGAIAQFERELIKGRTRMGKIASAEMGHFIGSKVPYGYKKISSGGRKGSILEIIPEEQKWVEKIFTWYAFEDLGYGTIADKLNNLNVKKPFRKKDKPTTYRPWLEKHIKVMLTSIIYSGQYIANKTDSDGSELPGEKWTVTEVPACVSHMLYHQAQEARKTKSPGTKNLDGKYLLSGKIFDTTVSPPGVFTGRPRADGKNSYVRKKNVKKGYHNTFEIPAAQLEDYVWTEIMTAFQDPQAFIQKWIEQNSINNSDLEILETERRAILLKIEELNLQVERVETAYDNGSYSEEKMNTKIIRLEKEINENAARRLELEKQINVYAHVDIERKKLTDASEKFTHNLENLTRVQQKTLVQLFVDRVDVHREPLPKQPGHKRHKWKQIYRVSFNFNPSSIISSQYLGGSTKGASDIQKEPLGPSINDDVVARGRFELPTSGL
jgi:site-specific DNA recombinase